MIEISENGYSKEPVAHFRGNQLKRNGARRQTVFLECGDVEAIKKQKGYEGLLAVIEKEPVIYIKSFGPLCELDAASLAFLKPSAGILQKGEPLFSQLGAKTVGCMSDVPITPRRLPTVRCRCLRIRCGRR